MSEIIIPNDLWEEDDEAVITSWLVDDGGSVKKNQIILELMVEKTTYELLSPYSGKINIIMDIDEIVSKGQVVATIDD